MSKGKNPPAEAQKHQSRPLASLKDPAVFGPPPKNKNYHVGAAVPDGENLGCDSMSIPIKIDGSQNKEKGVHREDQATNEDATGRAPIIPFRGDTVGLSTQSLPKPPRRQLGDDSIIVGPSTALERTKPSLPPRLPPRQGSSPSNTPNTLLPAYSASKTHEMAPGSYPNEEPLKRLGSAGINVPAFGITSGPKSSTPWDEQRSPVEGTLAHISPQGHSSRLQEMQSTFPKLATNSPTTSVSSQGTSLAQKQAALKTASAFRNDPSSVSLSEARSAASTANNFRERHGDQVAAGWRTGNALNKKYNVMDKINGHSAQGSPSVEHEPISPSVNMETPSQPSSAVRKKPPPLPPKKSIPETESASFRPPIPLASKPR